MSQFLKHSGDPKALGDQAYRQGFYVEAIQILHAFLENQARSLLMLVGNVHFQAKQKDTWGIADSFSFHECLKALFVLNQITKQEFDDFNKFNSMRNKIVHQIFREPYEEIHDGVPKSEYDAVFRRTLEQIEFFTHKNEEIVG